MTDHTDVIRWQTPEGLRLAQEIFARFAAGKALDDLRLGEHDGRVNLRGLCVPETIREKLPAFRKWDVYKVRGQVRFNGAHFEGLDLGHSELEYLHLLNSRIINCCFDNANCAKWGLWGTDVAHTSFINTNLRAAVLGPWYENRGNTYQFVNFSRADMRDLVSPAATYMDCDFSNAKLDKVEFESSSFIRCRFAGELREVMFYDHGFKTGKPDPNPMEDVDFSEAKLRWVDFRRLNLDRVKVPDDRDHVIVKYYRCVLERALAALKDNETPAGRGLMAVLKNDLKWIGPRREVGIFNRLDFREVWGEEGEEFAVRILRTAEQECSTTIIH